MSESLRQRVSKVIAGGAHALLDKIEDATPVAVLEQSVREVERMADEVRAAWGNTIASRHLAHQQRLHLEEEHEQLTASITQALGSGREDLAKPAIARQLDIEAQLPVLTASLADLATQERELSGFVDALMGKKREMESAIADLERSRKAGDGIAVRGVGSTAAVASRLEAAQSAFDRTYQRQTGLDPAALGATLDQAAKLKELNELVRENKIQERLIALKAR